MTLTDNQKKILIIGSAVFVVIVIIAILILAFANRPGADILETSSINTTDYSSSEGTLPPADNNSGYQPTDNTDSTGLPPASSTYQGVANNNPETYSDSDVSRDNKIEGTVLGGTISPTLAPNGGLQFYDVDTNKFVKMDSDGRKTELSGKEFYDVDSVTWSPTKDKAVIYYPDNTKIIYDFKNERQTTIPKHWEELQFSPAGDQLSFKSFGFDTNNTWLGIVNADGTGAKAVEKLGENVNKAIVSWSPNNQSIGMFVDAIDGDKQQVIFIGANGENFRSMVAYGRNIIPNWSPSGQELLYSAYSSTNNLKPQLWISAAAGDNIGNDLRQLNIETYASKCAFMTEKEIICGVPQSLPDGAGLSPIVAEDIPDNIYLIDTISGSKITLDASGQFNVNEPLYSKTDKAFYFFSKLDGSLHKLSVK